MSQILNAEEAALLLQLCRIDHVTVEKEISQALLYSAKANGVAAWCYLRYKKGEIKGVEESLLNPWKQAYLKNTIFYQKYLEVYNKVQHILNHNHIPVIALKGMALSSHLYPDEGLRPMGDIDILVPDGRGGDALEILLANGARQTVVPRSLLHEQVDAHVRAIVVDGILVEIHQRLFALGSVYHIKGADYFSSTVTIKKQGVEITQLSDVWMLYHLVAHAIKGIHMGGLRLGWLLDIALLLKQSDNREQLIVDMKAINPHRQKEISNWLAMAMLLLSSDHDLSDDKRLVYLMQLMVDKDVSSKHRIINLIQLLKTPGIGRKTKLLWRESFPTREYMKFRYGRNNNKPLWNLYLRRVLGRGDVRM